MKRALCVGRRAPLHLVFKQPCVVLHVVLVHAEAPVSVDPVQSCAALSQDRHVGDWIGDVDRQKGFHRRIVNLLRHLVVQRERDLGLGFRWNLCVGLESVAPRHLLAAQRGGSALSDAVEWQAREGARTSMRGIVDTPDARRMDTAFVDHAVVKFRRGPSSRTHATLPEPASFFSRNDSSEYPEGSKVSRRQ